MKTLLILAVLSVFSLVSQTNACGGGSSSDGGGSSDGGSSSSDSGGYTDSSQPDPEPAPKQEVKVGTYKKIRDRDETGHRTGLGTIGKSLIRQPVKTVKAAIAMYGIYKEMKRKNVIGGNLEAHEKANKEATKIAGEKVAGALSAAREQYKNFRDKTNPDGVRHIGDTRTDEERKATMDANKRGREQGLAEEKEGKKED